MHPEIKHILELLGRAVERDEQVTLAAAEAAEIVRVLAPIVEGEPERKEGDE